MNAIDFKKDPTYKAKTVPAFIEVPTMRYISVTGEGAPEASDSASTEFQEAMQVLYGLVYSIKFWDKKFTPPAGYTKFSLAPVEALWWTGEGEFDMDHPEAWQWQALLRVPDFVTQDFLQEVVQACVESKKSQVYRRAELFEQTEGTCVQIMHVGPYSAEPPTIARLHDFVAAQGFTLRGKHHELYFGDPRRTAPEKLKTILRQPVTRV